MEGVCDVRVYNVYYVAGWAGNTVLTMYHNLLNFMT